MNTSNKTPCCSAHWCGRDERAPLDPAWAMGDSAIRAVTSRRMLSLGSATGWLRPALQTARATVLGALAAGVLGLAMSPTAAQAQDVQSAQDGPLQHAVPPHVRNFDTNEPLVTAEHGMVATAQHLATQVGVDVLKSGGNAIDAAVAVGYALAVVHPCCGNIGGDGFMTIHLADGQNLFLSFRIKAPLKARPGMMQDASGQVVKGRSTETFYGVGVPGTVMGLNEALEKYGTITRQQALAPAIKLAMDGYKLEPGDVRLLDTSTKVFAKFPNVSSIFLNRGQPWKAGEVLKQPALARTLELISRDGTRAFYDGPIAAAIVKASNANNGLLTLQDFKDYTVQWAKPIECSYHGYTIVTAALPSSALTMCETLQILAPYPLAKWGFLSAQSVHYFVEAERRAFADRNTYLGDPAFVHSPVDRLLSPAYAEQLRSSIHPDRATPSSEVGGGLGPFESTDTTHYSVVDGKGNAVSVTYTLDGFFGVKQMAGDTGFFLNNDMDNFTSKPGVPNQFGLVQGKANQIEPGKRPLSSMSPTLVLKDGKLVMVTGSPGGSTIISTTMQSILNVIEYGMNVKQAIDAPRIHMQWYPDEIFAEPGAFTPEVQEALVKMGYKIRPVGHLGDVAAIVVNQKTGKLESANDPRYPAGSAAGY